MNPSAAMRGWLRRHRRWVEFQEWNREGWRAALDRRQVQVRILSTPPVRTAGAGPVEVRVLTWRRDCLNVIWALKSFYHFAEVDFPLAIHDGGLAPGQADLLRSHFPDATFVPRAEADRRIEAEFAARGWDRCVSYRRLNSSTPKLFDFFAFSSAEHVLSIDSDIVFFRRPDELVDFDPATSPNLYNADVATAYSMTPEEMISAFGVAPPPLINSGLNLARRESMDFTKMDAWLAHPKMYENRWVTEQTLHALCSTIHGVALLPASYLVSVEPGLDGDLACKHYPGFFRPLLYSEGMSRLIDRGFLSALASPRRSHQVR